MRPSRRFTWDRLWAASVVTGLAFATSSALAQDTDWDEYEYEPGEGLHQQEWYDPSDWFDTDNGIDYEYDYGDYDPYYTEYDYYDPYDPYDYSYYDPYGYNGWYTNYYGWDNQSSNSDRNNNDNYGWHWNDSQNEWEYGYQYDNNQRQNNAGNRNQQSANRGQQGQQFNWQNRGQQQNDRYTTRSGRQNDRFSSQSGQGQQHMPGSQQQMRGNFSPEQVHGKIVKTTTVDVFGNKHVLAKVRKSNDKTCIVDLGPQDKVSQLNLQQGDTVRIQGRRGMLSAGSVRTNDQVVTIDRRWAGDRGSRGSQGTRTVQGEIDTLSTRSIDGQRKLVAYVDGQDGLVKRVNLGSKQHLQQQGLNLQEGDRIRVRGQSKQVDGRTMIVADQISKMSGQSGRQGSRQNQRSDAQWNRSQHDRNQLGSDWNRSQNRRNERGTDRDREYETSGSQWKRSQERQGQSRDAQRAFQGQVTRTWTEQRDGSRHMFATVSLDNGQRVDVDLGERSQFDDLDISSGDEIRVRGHRESKPGSNEPCIVASSVRVNGGSWKSTSY